MEHRTTRVLLAQPKMTHLGNLDQGKLNLCLLCRGLTVQTLEECSQEI